MKYSLTIFLALFFPCASLAGVQSEFRGPVRLKVWQHWQQSWNVEDVTADNAQFFFERGTENGVPYIQLRYRNSAGQDLKARIRCDGYVRTALWNVAEKTGNPYAIVGRRDGEWNIFRLANAPECLDKAGDRIVTRVEMEVFSGARQVFAYQLKPMYVRGSKSHYWNNPIDPFSAHGGFGQVSVATAMSGESGWDKWNGVLVKPTLDFVDRNTMTAGSLVGLHRHQTNQELYFIEMGQMKMLAGVANRSGANYTALRLWDGSGRVQETTEFQAAGGWIEERILEAGEVSVIVPAGLQKDTIYFHGIQALTNATFWTMGAKN